MEGKFEEIGGIKHFITDDKKYRVVQTLEIVYHTDLWKKKKKKTICHKEVDCRYAYIEGKLDLRDLIFFKTICNR